MIKFVKNHAHDEANHEVLIRPLLRPNGKIYFSKTEYEIKIHCFNLFLHTIFLRAILCKNRTGRETSSHRFFSFLDMLVV